MAQRTAEDVIYDKLIDTIQNNARDNELRDEYDRFMSDRNYNNSDMTQLFEHCVKMVELGWEDCRNTREEDKLIAHAVDESIAQHIGVWATSDKHIANSIDNDRVWGDLKAAATEWDRVEHDYDRASRGNRSRSGRDDRDDRNSRSRGGRDNRNTGLGYSQSRPPAGRDDRDRDNRRDRGDSRMSGGFGANRDNKPREAARNSERDRPTEQRSRSPLARAPRTEERPVTNERLKPHEEPADDDVIELNAGPDFTLPRPFDDFWDNGENWQLAHVSKWSWTWTPKAQFCRTYDQEHEVRFLVKDKNGVVREEFLPMTDDLSSVAHEIKALTRPNEGRRLRDGGVSADGEVSLPGNDIDAVDLNQLAGEVEATRLTLITEMNLSNIHVEKGPIVTGSTRDCLIKTTVLRLKTSTDVAVAQNMCVEVVPSSGRGRAELESLGSMLGTESGLDVLQKRLLGLRGKVDESVLDLIDAHYTAEVNHTLSHAWGFGKTKIDSFIEDFSDLLSVISSMRGAGFTAQFIQRTRNIVTSLVVMADGESTRDVIDSQDLFSEAEADPAEYTRYRETALVFLRPTATLSINIDLEAFGTVGDDTRVPVSSGTGADPELRDALTGLFLAGRKASATGRVFAVTGDNIIVELVGMAGARDVVGIRKA